LNDADTSIATTAFVRTGVSDGSSAAAGMVGEVISSVVTSGVPLTTNVAASVASISLSAGDWDVQGEVWGAISTGGSTGMVVAINTSAGIPTLSLGTARSQINTSFTASALTILPIAPCRVNLAATTTYFLVAQIAFPSGATTATGKIWARRAR
jgi:hypothetical protein